MYRLGVLLKIYLPAKPNNLVTTRFRLKATFKVNEDRFDRPQPIPLGDEVDRKKMKDLIKKFETHVTENPNLPHRDAPTEQLKPFPGSQNPRTGELNGPKGPEPTRFGDWERNGRVYDF